jgi:hypothetical protein
LVSSNYIGDSQDKDFGPRSLSEDELERRRKLYPPIDPEKLQRIREEGWTASATYMLLNQRKKPRAVDSKSQKIREIIKNNPELSNPEIAKQLGVLNSLVHHVRMSEKKTGNSKTLEQIAEEVGCPLQFVVDLKEKLDSESAIRDHYRKSKKKRTQLSFVSKEKNCVSN